MKTSAREKWRQIIFEADTRAGRAFDVSLILCILVVMLASILMVMGYGIIAAPTGIVTAEFTRNYIHTSQRRCPNCTVEGHAEDARYCRRCGQSMPNPINPS